MTDLQLHDLDTQLKAFCIFLHFPDNQLTMNIKEIVAQNPDILKHWSELKPAVDERIKDLQLTFFKKVHEKLLQNKHKIALRKNIGIEIKNIHQILDYDKKYGHNGFIFIQSALNLPNKRQAFFAIEHDFTDIYFGVFGFDTYLDKDKKNAACEKLHQKLPNHNIMDNGWWIFTYLKPNNVSFLSDANAHYLATTNMDELVEKFVAEVEAFLAAWQEII